MLSKKQALTTIDSMHFYIGLAPDTEVTKGIRQNTRDFRKLLKSIPSKKRKYKYAEGKWSIQEMLQHIIDTERVFSYRAVSIARRDITPLPGFNENDWANAANATPRKWNDLVEEFEATRKSIELLFKSLPDEDLLSSGTASNNPVNVLAFGYVIAGYAQHHMNVIKEKYLSKKK